MSELERFHRLVLEACAEQQIEPPFRIYVNTNPKRRASATALRFWSMGTGFITTTQAMVDDLTDAELSAVIRHELSHYAHGEARWAIFQGLFALSPLLVFAWGWPLARTFGATVAMLLYFVSLALHVSAFKWKRYFEARADRESVHNAEEAKAAQRALLKFGTLKERHERNLVGAEADAFIDAFDELARRPLKFSDEMFNAIWGIHPPLKDRLPRYDKYAESKKAP